MSSEEPIKQCQICKTTEIAAGWRCTSCGRPICIMCYEDFKSVGTRVECFNALCRRTNNNKLVPIDKTTKISTSAVGVGMSISFPSKQYSKDVKSSVSRIAEKWAGIYKKAFER